jgi:hypothetical protein
MIVSVETLAVSELFMGNRDGKRASGHDQNASIHKTPSVDLAIPQGKLVSEVTDGARREATAR